MKQLSTNDLNLSEEIIFNENKLISDYMGITSKKIFMGWIIISKNGTKLTSPTWTEDQSWNSFLNGYIFHKSMDWLIPVISNILENQSKDEKVRKDIYGLKFKHNEVSLILPNNRILTEKNTTILNGTYNIIIKYLKELKKFNTLKI